MRVAVAAKRVAQAVRVIGRVVRRAMVRPQMISPRYSSWARNEWVVARTSAVVRALTQIVLITRVSGVTMPARSTTAIAPTTGSRARASMSMLSTPATAARAYAA
jgi:hypothetical protein